MQVKELGHLVLYVRDVRRSAHFYREVLGWRQVVGADDDADADADLAGAPIAVFNAAGGRTHHELLLIEVGADATSLPRGRRLGMYHFGLKIGDSDEELREAIARLEEHDVPVLGATDHHVSHSLYIADPDGNEIELYVDVAGVDWRNDPSLVIAAPRPLRL